MRIFWTLIKVVIGLAIAIPVGMFVLALTAGVVTTLIGIAILALRLAVFGLVAYGAYRLVRFVFAPSKKVSAPPMRELPPRDPYYDAALRELDAELGSRVR